jgi:hypothetical protein
MKVLDPAAVTGIPGLIRCEVYGRDAMAERLTEMTHTVYAHDQVYGEYCTIHAHIDCPPQDVFRYMANPYSLLEWTYSVRKLRQTQTDGLLAGEDGVGTPIYCRTTSDERALTVDYHCAWDQGEELWMVYFNRVLPADVALKRKGSVVVWTNCRHPYYARNPFPHLCHDPNRTWVGDLWPFFYAGHTVELLNLKAILEYRHRNRLPIGPMLADDPHTER